MTPTEYNIESKKFERTLPPREAVFHALVGLCGETGEYLTERDVDKKHEEAGDVFWYLFCLDRALAEYTSHRAVLAAFDEDEDEDEDYLDLRGESVGIQALLLSERVKKSMYARRPLTTPSTDKTLAPRLVCFARTLLEDYYLHVKEACLPVNHPRSVDLSTILEKSIEKLTRRMVVG